MGSLMKSDFFRLFKSKTLYIAGIAFLLFSCLSTVLDIVLKGSKLAAIPNLSNIISSSYGLVFFLIPFLVFLILTDFNDGTIKNIVSSGISRTKFFVSKVIVLSVVAAVLYLLSLVLSFSATAILNGLGSGFDAAMGLNILKAMSLQGLMFIGIICFGVAISYTTRSTGAVVGICVLLFALQGTLIGLLVNATKLPVLMQFDFVGKIKSLGNLSISSTEALWAVGVGAGLMLVSLIIGAMRFRKVEIK